MTSRSNRDSSSESDEVTDTTERVRSPIPQQRATLVERDLGHHRYNLRNRKRPSENTGRNNDNKRRRMFDDQDVIYRGDFESARNMGISSQKWLMVNFQDSAICCRRLNLEVWNNDEVKRLVSQHFILWQVFQHTWEGQRYSQFYMPDKFPYIAILDPRTGEKLVVWHSVDTKTICELINVFLSENRGCLEDPSEITDSSQDTVSLLEDKSLDLTINEALTNRLEDSGHVASNWKVYIIKLKGNSSGDFFDTNDMMNTSEIDGKNKTENTEKWRDGLGGDNDPKLNLIIRLPNGDRQEIRWPCTSKIKSLLLYMLEIGYDAEEYELVTIYPRRNLVQLDSWKTLEEIGLYPREVLFLQLKMTF